MDRRVQRGIAILNQQLATAVTVATLAADVNLSPSRFAHLFRREVGTSPTRYIRAARLVRAYLLLTRTFLTVKEVMALVGCNDASHFSRDFRRFHGVSPTAARQRKTDAQDTVMAALLTGESSTIIGRIAALANERLDSPMKTTPQLFRPC